MKNENTDRLIKLAENGIGDYLRIRREAAGYRQKEICDGICSEAALSRIEKGGRPVDFLMIEALLGRMKVTGMEYEFVLDEEDYIAYRHREEIQALVRDGAYGQATERMAAYESSYCGENKYGTGKLHSQFLSFQRAFLEKTKPQPCRRKAKALFLEALRATAPEYEAKLARKEILSNLELSCVAEILYCTEESLAREKEFEELYAYYAWDCEREGFYPVSYRAAMQYYGECLYQNGKYEKCIRICGEGLEELFRTSKVENREELFLLRAKARERKGFGTKEEKELCLKDFLTAYHLKIFYGKEDRAESLRQHIGGTYGWQFID